jgi:hypothetical protein
MPDFDPKKFTGQDSGSSTDAPFDPKAFLAQGDQPAADPDTGKSQRDLVRGAGQGLGKLAEDYGKIFSPNSPMRNMPVFGSFGGLVNELTQNPEFQKFVNAPSQSGWQTAGELAGEYGPTMYAPGLGAVERLGAKAGAKLATTLGTQSLSGIKRMIGAGKIAGKVGGNVAAGTATGALHDPDEPKTGAAAGGGAAALTSGLGAGLSAIPRAGRLGHALNVAVGHSAVYPLFELARHLGIPWQALAPAWITAAHSGGVTKAGQAVLDAAQKAAPLFSKGGAAAGTVVGGAAAPEDTNGQE